MQKKLKIIFVSKSCCHRLMVGVDGSQRQAGSRDRSLQTLKDKSKSPINFDQFKQVEPGKLFRQYYFYTYNLRLCFNLPT